MPRFRTCDLIELVLEDYATNGKRTAHSVRSHSRNLLRHLPELPSPRDITRYKEARLSEGAAPATIRNELSVLKRGFRLARRFGLVMSVPLIEFPRVENTRDVICSLGQFRLMLRALEVLDRDVQHFVLWLALMGWRRNQAARLEWRFVGDDLRTVTSPQRANKNRLPHVVGVGDTLRDLLAIRRDLRRGPLVFHRRGRPMGRFTGPWRRATTAAGCPDLVPHDLRRLFAQTATDANVPIPVQLQIAGWKTDSTHRRYCIAKREHQSRALDAVAKLAGL